MGRRRSRAKILEHALAQALAQQDLSVAMESSPHGRLVTLVRQSSGERIEAEEDDDEGGEEDGEDEEGEDDEGSSAPALRVNTKFLSRTLTALARTNARKAASAQLEQQAASSTAPLPPPKPRRSLAERRERAMGEIHRIAASCGLLVSISVNDAFTEVDMARCTRSNLQLVHAKPGAGTSRLLGAALQGALKRNAPEAPGVCGDGSEEVWAGSRKSAVAADAAKAGAVSAPELAREAARGPGLAPKRRRAMDCPAIQAYVPPPRRQAQ